ncbi:MAG: hypothetical protein U0556_13615 [Dehalococcoidia bacterium]
MKHSVLARFLALAGFALLMAWGAWAGPRALVAGARTALLLPDLLVFQPLRPSVGWTLPPTRRTLTWDGPANPEQGDLYVPALSQRAPAVVVLLGVYPAPLEDPNVRRLGDGLARTGLVALFPNSPRLQAGHITPEEIDAIVGGFAALQALPEVDPDRVGLLGLSVGGGLALVAAGDERLAEKVASIQTVGGYFDARDLLRQIGSRTALEPGRPAWQPSDLALVAYRRQLIDMLPLATDRDALEAAYLSADPIPADPARMSPTGKLVMRLIEESDPEVVDRLFDQLPADALARLRRLSPREWTGAIRAPVFILHDRADPYVPVGESRRLAEALGNRARFREYRLFAHVVPSGEGDLLRLPGEIVGLASQINAWYLELGR